DFARNDKQFALAKTAAFACLFRHATRDFLHDWFAARRRHCFSANAKTRLTFAVTEADAAGVPACFDRYGSQFTDKQDRHCPSDQKGSKRGRRNVLLSRGADRRCRSKRRLSGHARIGTTRTGTTETPG